MSSIVVAGDTSGSITISAPLVAGSNTLSLPAVTDTLAGIAATQTLTNKTLVAPALGTVASGVISACTSSGMVMVAPALGTPASGVLTNCTGVPAAALPAGSVIQVVNGTYATIASNNTSTFTTTGLTATITPRSTSSKILVFANVVGVGKASSNTQVKLRLYRGVSSIIGFEDYAGANAGATQNSIGSCSTTYLDSPATTSSTTYTVYFASTQNSGTAYVQDYGVTQANATSTITLMEIQG